MARGGWRPPKGWALSLAGGQLWSIPTALRRACPRPRPPRGHCSQTLPSAMAVKTPSPAQITWLGSFLKRAVAQCVPGVRFLWEHAASARSHHCVITKEGKKMVGSVGIRSLGE